jgi:HEPN domain-containing protein
MSRGQAIVRRPRPQAPPKKAQPTIHPETYLRAAQERLRQAQAMVAPDDYALAHYLAGLAVESVLRAYLVRANAQFDAKHDIRKLVSQSQYYGFIRPKAVPQVAAAVAEIALRWSNLHRYRDVKDLEHWLKGRNLHDGVKGNVLKHSRDVVLEAALEIVTEGVLRWKSV